MAPRVSRIPPGGSLSLTTTTRPMVGHTIVWVVVSEEGARGGIHETLSCPQPSAQPLVGGQGVLIIELFWDDYLSNRRLGAVGPKVILEELLDENSAPERLSHWEGFKGPSSNHVVGPQLRVTLAARLFFLFLSFTLNHHYKETVVGE